MASNTAKIIFWTLGIAAVGGLGYFLYKRFGGSNKVKLTQEELDKLIADAKASGEIKNTTPSEAIQVLSESFPLAIGMKGDKIKALQVKLGVTPTTGYFGNKTNAAIQSKGYSVPLSEGNYNKIMGIVSNPVSPSNVKKGDAVYLKSSNGSIYSYPQVKSDYVVGSIKKTDILDRAIGTFDSEATNGFVKLNLSVSGRKLDNTVKIFNGTFYILKEQLSTTPY